MNQEQLTAYFEGRATALEKQQLADWVRAAPGCELFYEALARWERAHPQFTLNHSEALTRHMTRMAALTQPTTFSSDVAVGRLGGWVRWQRGLLAVSVLLILTGTGWFFREPLLNQMYLTTYGQTQTVILPDGSEVTLNANSRLTFPRWGFGTRSRTVTLSGEARFSVRHTVDNQLFVVKTGQAFDVLVLGTEFTVFARRRGAKVALIRGSVQVRYRENDQPKKRLLTPGDLVMVTPKGRVIPYKTTQPEQQAAWVQHRYVFDQTPLSELAAIFAEQFGVSVTIPDPALACLTISGSFTACTADELLEILAETANLSYRKNENCVVLTP